MALNEIFSRNVEMMRQVQEESSTNVQCMVEESTYRVRKEMMFDDEYEPLEEVEEELVNRTHMYISNQPLFSIPTIFIIYHL